MDVQGEDEDGKPLKASELWKQAAGPDGTNASWYSASVEYWDRQEASYDGVLGGFGEVSGVDVRDSLALLKKAFKALFEAVRPADRVAIALERRADCGAGVGRVSEQLLLHHFGTVDVLEPSRHLLDAAQRALRGATAHPAGHRAGDFLCLGLEAWKPPAARYDCVWVQWCLLYLTDDDIVALLQRATAGLRGKGGAIVVKENVCASGFVVDRQDNSLTRSNAYLLGLFARAAVAVAYNVKQRGMPDGIYEIRMYVLRPKA